MSAKKKYNLDYFTEKNLSFVLIKNDSVIYKSYSQGLKPLVFCLKKYKKEMKGAIVFDKIVGLAAAKLLAYSGVKEVWTPTISRNAKKYLLKNKIKTIYKREVKNILNRDGSDLCPVEKIGQKKELKELLKIFKIS